MLDNRVDRDIFIKRMVTSPSLYKKIIPLAFKDPYLAEVLGDDMHCKTVHTDNHMHAYDACIVVMCPHLV